MVCQRCGKREAAIHMYANVNGERQAVNLCQACYYEVVTGKKSDQPTIDSTDDQNNMNRWGNNGWNDLDNIFRQFQGRSGFNASNINQGNFSGDGGAANGGNGFLDQYGTNLTELARQGKFDPIIGRDEEIQQIIEILNRRNKNNPVLIGEAGVGKTAVVEGLAQRIVNKEVPQKLQSKEVISLDVASLIQGTGVRGQFEEKMQKLIKEVSDNKNIILFIDEIHEIVGAGGTEGNTMDAGNILKPALARGEMQLVGATTFNEFRNIEKDAALARRLQPITVNEPSVEETIKIIKGIAPKYEKFHSVKYSDDALKATVTLSDRYITDRQLPDKAIDLLDESGSKKNLSVPFVDKETLDKQIEELEKLKTMATESEDYEKAAYYRDQLQHYKELRDKNESVPENTPVINVSDIQKLIEKKTGIPVGDLQENEQTQLVNLDKNLKANVIGQDDAVKTVANAIRRNRIGFNKSERPIGSFLFVGPTGVGKTEMARQLAEELFGSKDAMVRFDMSEYMEKHSVSKLIGSPPGYVGYEEAGQLTERVRRHPYSLILLDEIEKAHPDVLNTFLQVMEDGRLTDAQGRTVSFKDTILIMTSNAGSGNTEASVGFGARDHDKEQANIINQLEEFFKPEFLNRFDAIVKFNPLKKEQLIKIVDLMIDELNDMLDGQEIHIDTTKDVKERLVDLGYNPEMGARPLRRIIQDQIENQVADVYLKNPELHYVHFDTNTDNQIVVDNFSSDRPAENSESADDSSKESADDASDND
ncbi:MAG: AAA family ATPase [Aerococcus sp.]|nr:AAA family ATPase [Aerococcus sp.]